MKEVKKVDLVGNNELPANAQRARKIILWVMWILIILPPALLFISGSIQF